MKSAKEHLLPQSDILLIVPPYTNITRPSLGLHILQSVAKKKGYSVGVFYANMALAKEIGIKNYTALMNYNGGSSAVWMFAPFAFQKKRLKEEEYKSLFNAQIESLIDTSTMANAKDIFDMIHKVSYAANPILSLNITQLIDSIETWLSRIHSEIIGMQYKIVGCTSMFFQRVPSFAILNGIKKGDNTIITIMGGANCEGVMARGLAEITSGVDYFFSGESEKSFAGFLDAYKKGELPETRVIEGGFCEDLNEIPNPDYSDFFNQLEYYFPGNESIKNSVELLYETSRGCYWGQKKSCTFCGFNGNRISYRMKPVDKVVTEIKELHNKHRIKHFRMVDNAAPKKNSYHIFKRLEKEVPGLKFFYEIRPDFTFEELGTMKKGGLSKVNAGFESIVPGLLKGMNKGLTVNKNITTLRYLRILNIKVYWNLLWGFPHDTLEDYVETIEFIKKISHLAPPERVIPLGINRFSPYFNHPEKYNLHNIRPRSGLKNYLPGNADIDKIDFHFTADFECSSFSNLSTIYQLKEEVEQWRYLWSKKGVEENKTFPLLKIEKETDSTFIIYDTRPISTNSRPLQVNRKQAYYCLFGHTMDTCEETRWAQDNNFIHISSDNKTIPLAVADADLLMELEKSSC